MRKLARLILAVGIELAERLPVEPVAAKFRCEPERGRRFAVAAHVDKLLLRITEGLGARLEAVFVGAGHDLDRAAIAQHDRDCIFQPRAEAANRIAAGLCGKTKGRNRPHVHLALVSKDNHFSLRDFVEMASATIPAV